MVILKTEREIEQMKKAGTIAANAVHLAGKAIEPGISTLELDTIIRNYIESKGAKPSSLGYGGFPNSACISVNNEVIHGIPSKSKKIKSGDIVSIDVAAFYEGFHGDTAFTFTCGEVSKNAKSLLDATYESLLEGIKKATCGNRIGDISSTIQTYVEARGYSVVRDFVGHGIGAQLHEDPSVPNYGVPSKGVRLLNGMTIAIEPMINEGTAEVEVLPDGWTAVTKDGKLSAHFEHTVAVTSAGPMILTLPDQV
ncbi:MAG: type I methionyl aminopeptidase [Clostridia bacterium]|nr:type I methionyl aminopeptidase [Clostridia bacterium]